MSMFTQAWLIMATICAIQICLRVESLSEADKILVLPGQPQVSFQQYGGYITVDEKQDRALFYYFAEAETDPSSKPLVLWLNGGPGCSSVGVGAFCEHGPFKPSGQVLVKNDCSWNKEANMLYLESPAGVGFSYSANKSFYTSVNDEITAQDNLVFLKNWFNKFPEYKNRDFYITGESYAGHYVPQLAQLIIQSKMKFNLKGIAIGNPLLEFNTDFNSRAEFYWSHGLISDATYELFTSVCNYSQIRRQFQTGTLTPICSGVNNRVSRELSRFINRYDVTLDVCLSTIGSQAKVLDQLQGTRKIDVCIEDETITYLNRADVQKAFHARLVGVTTWGVCSDVLYYEMQNLEIPTILGSLVKSGIRVLVYRLLFPWLQLQPQLKGQRQLLLEFELQCQSQLELELQRQHQLKLHRQHLNRLSVNERYNQELYYFFNMFHDHKINAKTLDTAWKSLEEKYYYLGMDHHRFIHCDDVAGERNFHDHKINAKTLDTAWKSLEEKYYYLGMDHHCFIHCDDVAGTSLSRLEGAGSSGYPITSGYPPGTDACGERVPVGIRLVNNSGDPSSSVKHSPPGKGKAPHEEAAGNPSTSGYPPGTHASGGPVGVRLVDNNGDPSSSVKHSPPGKGKVPHEEGARGFADVSGVAIGRMNASRAGDLEMGVVNSNADPSALGDFRSSVAHHVDHTAAGSGVYGANMAMTGFQVATAAYVTATSKFARASHTTSLTTSMVASLLADTKWKAATPILTKAVSVVCGVGVLADIGNDLPLALFLAAISTALLIIIVAILCAKRPT